MRRLAAAVLALGAWAGAHAAEEVELKAAIVYNLLMFVEWPADAAPSMASTLVLCLAAESRYEPALRVLAERRVRGLQIQLRETAPNESAAACNALLLEDAPPARLAALARSLKNTSVLVIADGAAAASDGVVVSLQRSDNRVLFDLNLASARRARLHLSSKLIRLAREVIE